MRYIDTGRRDPAHTLGRWLSVAVGQDLSVRELRWQAGFFASEPLALFAPAMKRLADADGIVRLLIGSNDGGTSRQDVEQLLALSGVPRKTLQIGIVHFNSAYFHPKTIHIVRADGSETAYVGSSNVTAPGVNGLHIEAGVLLDTNDGDDQDVVAQIKEAIDWWFAKARPGLHLIAKPSDLDALVNDGILDIPRPVHAPGAAPKKSSATQADLMPLLEIPELPKSNAVAPTKGVTSKAAAKIPAAEWSKALSPSDAQRKKTGNQRGGVTLVKAGHPIDWKTYFRVEFFKSAHWTVDPKQPGKKREHCYIPFEVDFLGKSLGPIEIEISHEKGRESGQSNYTSELHLGPVLTAAFKAQDVTGRLLRLARDTTGGFSLSVL
jgi:hypothetical protein